MYSYHEGIERRKEMESLMIRKGQIEDISGVSAIYDRILDDNEKCKAEIGWKKDIYPTEKTAMEALKNGQLFVKEVDRRIVAAAIINNNQVKEYENCQWKYAASDEEIMVMHTLVVDPLEEKKGYGVDFVNFYEEYAMENHCWTLRIDTNEINKRARALYKKMGYREAGIVDCNFNGIADVRLVCLEKNLSGIIDMKKLTKNYGKNRGIDNVTLQIKRGEIFGFIGQNGAGKSTTIRTLMNLIFPTSGKAEINHLDCVADAKEIKKNLAYVPSEVNYYKPLKVKELLKYTMNLNGIKEKKKAKELCNYFELDENRLIRELSLGNRKKVSIVQALLKKPEIIILDEPTSGLDPLIQDRLFKKLLEEKEKGTCIFLSSHNLSEVEKYCDRVAIIKDGKIVKVADLKELSKNRKLRVTYKEVDGQEETMLFSGEINQLTNSLSKKNLESLEIEHVPLEEEFMKYYEEDK